MDFVEQVYRALIPIVLVAASVVLFLLGARFVSNLRAARAAEREAALYRRLLDAGFSRDDAAHAVLSTTDDDLDH